MNIPFVQKIVLKSSTLLRTTSFQLKIKQAMHTLWEQLSFQVKHL